MAKTFDTKLFRLRGSTATWRPRAAGKGKPS